MSDEQPELPFRYPRRPGYVQRVTSVKAAEMIEPDVARLQRLVLDALKEKARTAQELEHDLGLSGNTVRPRIRELVLLGVAGDSGLKRNTESGRKAIVWMARRGLVSGG